MNNTSAIADWVFWIAGGVLALGGVSLLVWALFWDRAQGRRRCPKCWYSMHGVPGMQCPECGSTATSEAGLGRTRRHWRMAGVAVVLGLAGYVTVMVPRLRENGWVELVPSGLLVLVAPADTVRPSPQFATRGLLGMPPIAKATTVKVEDVLADAVWERLYTGKLARWQSQIFVRRCLEESGATVLDAVMYPNRWLAGEPIPIRVPTRWGGGRRSDFPGALCVAGATVRDLNGEIDMAPTPKVACGSMPLALELRVDYEPIYGAEFVVPVVLVASAGEVLKHLETPEVTELVKRAIDIRLVESQGAHYVVVDDRSAGRPWSAIDFGVAYRVEVKVDGRVVGRGTGSGTWDYPVWKNWVELEMEWAEGAPACVVARAERARFLVIGDAARAFELYREWPFNKFNDSAWTGSYEATVRIDREWRRER